MAFDDFSSTGGSAVTGDVHDIRALTHTGPIPLRAIVSDSSSDVSREYQRSGPAPR